ncbi:unnamed protein product, partial [Ectocarpus sp. 4 AP-2014]
VAFHANHGQAYKRRRLACLANTLMWGTTCFFSPFTLAPDIHSRAGGEMIVPRRETPSTLVCDSCSADAYTRNFNSSYPSARHVMASILSQQRSEGRCSFTRATRAYAGHGQEHGTVASVTRG